MTVPYGPGASTSWGGRGQPPLDHPAGQAIAAVQGVLAQRQVPRLTPAEREEAQKAAEDEAQVCRYCIGLHKLPNGPGCPRIASFKVNGDGALTEVTYWPGKRWARGRVVLLEDAHEDGEEATDGDG